MSSGGNEWSLAELSEQTGLPGRTLRFYIARGLLAGPRKAGRGACYGPEHVAGVEAIQRLQRQGLTLAEVGRRLAESRGGETARAVGTTPLASGESGALAAEGWWHYRLAEDVVVQVRIGAPPWRLRAIRNELARAGAALRAGTTVENEHDRD